MCLKVEVSEAERDAKFDQEVLARLRLALECGRRGCVFEAGLGEADVGVMYYRLWRDWIKVS